MSQESRNRTVDEPRALGLLVRRDLTRAREAAHGAAIHWGRQQECERRAAALAREHGQAGPHANLLPSVEWARAHIEERIGETQARVDRLKQEIAKAPSRDLLARSIGRVVARLEPREIAQLRAFVTAPRAAIAFHARQTLKAIALGRDEERER